MEELKWSAKSPDLNLTEQPLDELEHPTAPDIFCETWTVGAENVVNSVAVVAMWSHEYSNSISTSII